MNRTTLVLGASGLVGRRVVQRLQRDGVPLRAATRTPRLNHEVRLDLLQPDTFAPALQGVGTVMLISRPGDEEADRHAAPLVGAMVAAGVKRVVVLSALGAERRPDFSLRRVERLVEASGLAWVHVRPNFFMQMLALPPLSTEIAVHGSLSLPLGDAPVAYVDADDVAAVLHRALVDASLDGQAFEVSGPGALHHGDMLQAIALRTGRPLRYLPIDEDSAHRALLARGFTERHAARALTFYRLVREGWCATPDRHVARLLGRPLRTWHEVVDENLSAWLPPVRAPRAAEAAPDGGRDHAAA